MKRHSGYPCWAPVLALAALLIAAALPGAVGYAQEGPRIERVQPAEGRCGSELMIKIFGANLVPRSAVRMPEGVEVRFTESVSSTELWAGIYIAEDAPPGPRPVTVSFQEDGRVGEVTLEGAFRVICGGPEPGPEGRPDLALLGAGSHVVDDGRRLVITVQVENVGDGLAPETIVRVVSQAAEWWGGEAAVPGLRGGERAEVRIELEIPDEVRGQEHTLMVLSDANGQVAEQSEDNNGLEIAVQVPQSGSQPPTASGTQGPSTPGKGGGLPSWLIPALEATIAGSLALAGLTFTIRYTIKIQHRREWQEQAKEEKPQQTCRPGTPPYCEKIKLKELDLDRRKVTHLTIAANDPASGRKRQERREKGDLVDTLNKAVRTRRTGGEREELQRMVAPVADKLLYLIGEWLRREPMPCDVSITGHLAGSKVTFQFVLYRCRRRGNVNIWEKDDGWEATLADERDEPVTSLHGVDAAESALPPRLAPQVTRALLHFVEQV